MAVMKDLHNNAYIVRAISPVAIGTTGTGKTSTIIDTRGYHGLEFVISYGTVTATSAVYTVLMTECDTTGGSFTSVADADMLGTEALAGLGATTPRTSGVSKNVTKKLGYVGNKRYVKLKVSSTITATTPISVDAILHHPQITPTS